MNTITHADCLSAVFESSRYPIYGEKANESKEGSVAPKYFGQTAKI